MRILTGDRPTGSLHLGHYIGSLKNRIKYQNEATQYIIIADIQALTDNYDRPEILENNILNVVCDYLAVGIDPKKSIIFLQSMISEIAELTVFFMNLVTVSRLKRNPTVKNEILQKGFEKSLPVGFFVYPISQAADILLFDPTHVPVGEDQLPMIEQANEIAMTFNKTYKTEIFKKVTAMVPKNGRLSGIDGKAKMSKSLGNAIFLSDYADVVKKKVSQMYTDPNHLKISDPGKIEGNIVFEYLDVFCDDLAYVNELKEKYKKGGLGDVYLKNKLTDVLNDLLDPIRKKRKIYENNLDMVRNIIKDGTNEARKYAKNKMLKIKNSMKIDSFYN